MYDANLTEQELAFMNGVFDRVKSGELGGPQAADELTAYFGEERMAEILAQEDDGGYDFELPENDEENVE